VIQELARNFNLKIQMENYWKKGQGWILSLAKSPKYSLSREEEGVMTKESVKP